jgi:glycosyltransferase involved in cell wall biosynthesis
VKKNIAIVITRLDLGGAQKVALYIAENLNRKKFNVHLIAGQGGYLDKTVPSSEFRVPRKGKPEIRNQRPGNKDLIVNLWPELVHPIDPLLDIIAFFKLRNYFIRNKIDIVHTHSSKAGFLGRLAAWSAKVPGIIHTIHGFPFHEFQNPAANLIYVLLERFAAKFTTKLIAVGRDVMDYGLKNGVGRPEQYVIIRPGIDVKQFRVPSSEFRVYLKTHGLDPEKFTIGMIGNLKKQKNPILFVEIAKQVIGANPETQFVFAGDGPLKEDCLELAKKYGIQEKVKFIGWTDEPGVFLKSIDLFLLTSLWEGMPCTLAQAAAAGLPCVVSDIYGSREFMNAIGARKFLYAPRDTAGAAEKIIEIIRTGGRAYKASPAKLLREFDVKFMLNALQKIYLQ